MKTLKVKSIIFSLLAIMITAVFMVSCEQQSIIAEVGNHEEDLNLKVMTETLGYAPELITKRGDDYIYDGCIVHNGKDLEAINNGSSLESRKYTAVRNNIRYTGTWYLDISDNLLPKWKNAFEDAIDEWNAINPHVRFTDNSNFPVMGTLLIDADDLNSSHKQAEFRWGEVKIVINTGLNLWAGQHTYSNRSHGEMVYVAMHELGHFIGLEHIGDTNRDFLWTPNSTCNDLTIDDYSLVQPNPSASYDWYDWNRGFTDCDRIAIDALYERCFIKSRANNKYLCSENGNPYAKANRPVLNIWEKFELEFNGNNGTYSIKGNNGRYADIQSGANYRVRFNGVRNDFDTNWELEQAGGSKVRIKSAHYTNPERYLDYNGGGDVKCLPKKSSGNDQLWTLRRLSECRIYGDCQLPQ